MINIPKSIFTDMFKWNPVYNFVMEVKTKYIKMFGEPDYNEHELNGNTVTCFEYWIEKIGNQKYKDRIKYLQLNQENTLLLVRYANYSDVLGGEEDITLDDMWGMYDGFYLECRSVVIDLEREKIVIAPFKKFRNLNECPENSVENVAREIERAKCVEFTNKLDGSMQCATWYDGKIVMSGSQALSTEKSWRLADGYRMLTESPNYVDMIKKSLRCTTFIFEYISVKDAHVVKYNKEDEGLYLIGIRDNVSGKQFPYCVVARLADWYKVKTTTIYSKTLTEVLEDVKTIKSEEQEGFVLNIIGKDDSSRLVKIKGDDYVHIHKIISKLSSINLILHTIADGTVDDLKAKIPMAYRSRVDIIEKVARKYVREQETAVKHYYEEAPKQDKKTFMVWVNNNVPSRYQAFVRNVFNGKTNNFLKFNENTKNPRYIKLSQMGVNPNDYATLFEGEQ